MSSLADLLADAQSSGVHPVGPNIRAADLEALAQEQGLGFFRLDLEGVETKGGFMRRAAEALRFPEYFGGNWDAFEDCLTDMSWVEAAGYVILLQNTGDFAAAEPAQYTTFTRIIESAIRYWQEREARFFVLVAD